MSVAGVELDSLSIEKSVYVQQCNTVNTLISSSKKEFYASIITENKSDPRVLFSCFDKMVNRKSEKMLPHYKDSKTSFEKNCFSAWASTLNMGLINKVDMVCLSPVGYGV